MSPTTRVLILDDEDIVCDRLGPALEKLGFVVETFTESRAALDRMEEQRFEIVITDLKMRGPDGMEVLRILQERWPETRAVVITGFATVDTAKEAMRRGAVDFIAKPFRMRRLQELVQRIAGEILEHGAEE
jgi:DNA-binding NtrC family response regulator